MAAIIGMLLLTSAAAAKDSPASQAKAFADGEVQSFLPATTGGSGLCQVRGPRGFYHRRHGYFASCSTDDGNLGKLEYVIVANARRGSFDIKAPFLAAQLDGFCANTDKEVDAVGVKGKYVEVFAATGIEDSLAKEIAARRADAIVRVPGHQSRPAC